MAGFLDNSGDIILDAVITDIGRTRLSQGNFSISKFALGDDEIQYNLYNKNHPSGSAYYDLEILQTPVFQGMTQANANINYGLLSMQNTTLLYLPTIVVNEKLPAGARALSYNALYPGLFTVCVNNETYTKLVTTDSQPAGDYTIAGLNSALGIILEAGLNTTDLKGDGPNQSTYLITKGLIDKGFSVYCDARFFTAVLGPSNSSTNTFNNAGGGGAANVTWAPLVSIPTSTTTPQLTNYNTYNIASIINDVRYYPGNATADTAVSALAGPRGTATILNFAAEGALVNLSGTGKDDKWTKYGSSVTIAGTSYDYIDSMVYVVGQASSATIQLSVRLLRLP
jgi:hypothetical protein